MSAKSVLIKFIRIYQRYISFVLRSFISGRCRFTPTCSEYSKAAVNKYGAMRGSFLSLKRILRCNPLFTSGYDPVK